jgi:hypothetical protein
MRRFQYKHTPFLTEIEMNSAGSQGWELVAVLYGDNSTSQFNQGSKVMLYWKRELGDASDDSLPPFSEPAPRPFDTNFR